MSILSKKVLVLCVVFAVLVVALGIVTEVVVSNRTNDLNKFVERLEYGFIRGYIEPDESDDMYVYIVLDDGYYVTRLSMYALRKDVYDSFDDSLKQIIDNREVGCLITATIAHNESHFIRMGYSYIKNIQSYDNSKESQHKVQIREYDW